MKRLIVEMVGTFFLAMAVATGNPLAMGAMLMAVMYMGAHVSGGQYNPAVSSAVTASGDMKSEMFWKYFCMQTIGVLIYQAYLYVLGEGVFMPGMMGMPVWTSIVSEAVMTFLLCKVVLVMSDMYKKKNAHVFGLAVGFTYMAITFMGGFYNPAITLGAFIITVIQTGSFGAFMPMLGAFIGPFIGAFAASRCYGYCK